jgi:hypothetical protein
MSARIARTLRVHDVAAGDLPAKPVRYWRSRPLDERLHETLQLHREGNALFKGGNPEFSYAIRLRHVANP